MYVKPRDHKCCLLAILLSMGTYGFALASGIYPWINDERARETLEQRITPPKGFRRTAVHPGSFAAWLRQLPMKPANSFVKLYDGRYKFNQLVHAAIIDIDVGTKDLQQCADAVMRLRAEYLYSSNRLDEIAFNFTSGQRITFSRWRNGWKPVVQGKNVSWARQRSNGSDYQSLRRYMNAVFAYAGTYSLAKEMKSVSVMDLRIGDVFIQGGFPGHAVLVADMVENPGTGEKRFLLLQSFMPAQDIHVLRNPKNPLSPWYERNFGATLITPEWIFRASDLKRFRRLRSH
jgi:hypothetical protein